MRDITLEELLEAGCHFGHQVTRQNPKAREFVFEARDGIHIIDLAKTKEYLDEALVFVKEVASRPNASLLIVGTKRQAQDIVTEEIKRANTSNIYSITNHWVGGTLSNFQEVKKNFQKLRDLTKLLGSEEGREKYTKRELGLFEKERAKLESLYNGISEIKELPSVLFVIDTHTENLAVREAQRMNIPVVGIVDTNADPDVVSNPIPANDDAVGSIKLLTSAVVDAWVEGSAKQNEKETQPKADGPLAQKVSKESKVETPVVASDLPAEASAKAEAKQSDEKKPVKKAKGKLKK